MGLMRFCEGDGDNKAYPVLLQHASQAGVPVLLDCGGVEGPISTELLQHLSIISPNETELARLTGTPSYLTIIAVCH